MSYLKFVKASHISLVSPPSPPPSPYFFCFPPPPHFSRFLSTNTLLLVSLHYHHYNHNCIVFSPLPPPYFYWFASSTTLTTRQRMNRRKGLSGHTMTTHTSTYRYVCYVDEWTATVRRIGPLLHNLSFWRRWRKTIEMWRLRKNSRNVMLVMLKKGP